MTEAEQRVLGSVSIEEPWALVEAFSGIVREHPEEVNRAGRLIAERLRAHGVPVTCMSRASISAFRGRASVQLGDRTACEQSRPRSRRPRRRAWRGKSGHRDARPQPGRSAMRRPAPTCSAPATTRRPAWATCAVASPRIHGLLNAERIVAARGGRRRRGDRHQPRHATCTGVPPTRSGARPTWKGLPFLPTHPLSRSEP